MNELLTTCDNQRVLRVNIYFKYLSSLTLRSGVDFIKVGRKAQIKEIALLKLGVRRKARSTPLKSFSKVGRRAQNSL